MKISGKLFRAALFSFIAILLSTGCKKTDTNSSPLGTIPDHFAQRVMMEEFTGEWCGACPGGEALIEQYKHLYGDSLVVVSVHVNDWLANSAYNEASNAFSQYNFGFPCAAINRIQDPLGTDFWYSYGDWGGRVPALLATDHKTGIALISSFSGDSATIEVHIAFKATNAYDMRLNVFLAENNIPAHAQSGTGPGYIQQQVLRARATAGTGDTISMAENKEIVKKYKISIAGYNPANLVFATFVEKWSTTETDREVFNARQVKLGETAKWE